MTNTLQFEFPANLSMDNFLEKVANNADIRLISRQQQKKIYYDSFDWRLYSNGILCEFKPAKKLSHLTLKNFEAETIASTGLMELPAFAHQFNHEHIRNCLLPLLEMRRLLPVCNLDYEIYTLNLVNNDKKIIVRLSVQEYEHINNRLFLQELKGYEKYAEQFIEFITNDLGLTVARQTVLLSALKQQGRKPCDYSSKLNIKLEPQQRADEASKIIYRHLLQTIKDNEQGTIADLDSEFLHDFRVAVRRTRSGLSQIKDVLPEDIRIRFAEFFSWLGEITGPTRDMDVYLLNFDSYKNTLPFSMRKDLNPLYDFLIDKQKSVQQELARKIRSINYCSKLVEWEKYLDSPVEDTPVEANALLTIKQLSDLRIWKCYRQVLHQGNKITEDTPGEQLHNLRKTCKKLRYLMEFFQNLYSDEQIKNLVKDLKGLQEVLGDFQDYEVQERNLKVFSEEMNLDRASTKTILAMGVLIHNLDTRRHKARNEFADKFTAFKRNENQLVFRILFKPHVHNKI